MSKNISQITLDKIIKDGSKPISKNFFYFKKILFWFLVGFSILIGSISFAIALSFLVNNDWNLYERFGFSFILKTLPYFWFVCLAAFIILGEFYYKKTYLGYRHRSIVIVGTYLLTTLILGSIIYSIRAEEVIERSIYEGIPLYHSVIFDRESVWSQPDDGLLSGEIILVDGNRLRLVDKNGLLWEIKIMEDAFIGPRVNITEGESIKIIGDIESGQVFIAREIRPWISEMGRMNLFKKPMSSNRKVNKLMR